MRLAAYKSKRMCSNFFVAFATQEKASLSSDISFVSTAAVSVRLLLLAGLRYFFSLLFLVILHR